MFRTHTTTTTTSNSGTPRRWRRRLVTVVTTGLLVAPAAVWAADGFTDVPDANVFHDDIDWLADAGVTTGCNPPDNDEFCPSDYVTREQMAAFMHRLADNQVVDAGAVGGTDASKVLSSATGRHGYVWACKSASASYDPADECGYSFNSADGSIQITRSGAGKYAVTFEDLGSADVVGGGHVQVTSYGNAVTWCKVGAWANVSDVSVTVRCYDAAGALTDSQFDLQFIW